MYIRVANSALVLTAGTAVTSGVAIPVDDNGDPCRHVRVTCEANFAYVKFGTSAQSTTTVATFSSILVNTFPSHFHTRGYTHISCMTRATTAVINVCPIEE